VTRAEVLAELKLAFYEANVPPDTFRYYLHDLADVPVPLLHTAVVHLCRTSGDPRRFPTLGQIRAACAEHLLGLPNEAEALGQVQALVAWTRQSTLERPVSVPALHPLVRRAFDLVGGSQAFRATDEPGVIRGQFGRFYRELRAGETRDAQLAPTLDPGNARVTLNPASQPPPD
jgi:hypothetical protein